MKYWVNVISKDQALIGVEGGFIQATEDKVSNLQLLHKEDVAFSYSPGTLFRAGKILQAFTTIARVADDAPERVETSARVQAWRRTTTPLVCEEAPIEPLIARLDFIQDKANWGVSLRRGMFEIGQEDARRIAAAMNADITG
jgi:hypothetical protein